MAWKNPKGPSTDVARQRYRDMNNGEAWCIVCLAGTSQGTGGGLGPFPTVVKIRDNGDDVQDNLTIVCNGCYNAWCTNTKTWPGDHGLSKDMKDEIQNVHTRKG